MSENKKILVVEDSKRLNDFIASQLSKNKFDVTQALNGKQALEQLKKTGFDLVVLDLKLGDTNGLTILRTIRIQNKSLPVMIISSINDDETKIEGFRIGCDDYLTKPFMASEMLMRIKRMLERNDQLQVSAEPILETIKSGPFEINLASHTVYKNGEALPMRKKYFDILLYFIKHPNIAIPFRNLYEGVWGAILPEDTSMEGNLYVNITNLRKLIEEDPGNPKYIVSIRNIGYIYNSNENE